MKQHFCTDGFCLALFFTYLGGMGWIGQHAFRHGNLEKLTHGFDWTGKLCGVDTEPKTLTFLYWCKPENGKLQDGICLDKCPTDDKQEYLCPGEGKNFNQTRTKNGNMIVSVGQSRELTKKPSYPTKELFNFCIPRDIKLQKTIASSSVIGSRVSQTISSLVGIARNWEVLLILTAICLFFGYIFLLFLRCCMRCVIYFLATVLLLGFFSCGGYMIAMGFFPDLNFFVTYFQIKHSPALYAWCAGGGTVFVGILYTVLLICKKQRIRMTINSTTNACTLLFEHKTLVLQPIINVICIMSAFSGLMYLFAYIVSLGQVTATQTNIDGVDVPGARSFTFTSTQHFLMGVWLVGTVWIIETISALGQYAIVHTVVKRTIHSENHCLVLTRGYLSGFFLHLGSIAYGAMVLGVLSPITATLPVIARKCRCCNSERPNNCVKKLLCCCVCCFSCCKEFLDLANPLVYSAIAIESVDYVDAVKNIMTLEQTYAQAFAAIQGSTSIVKWIGIIIMSSASGFSAYYITSSQELFVKFNEVVAQGAHALKSSGVVSTGNVHSAVGAVNHATMRASSMLLHTDILGATIFATIAGFIISFAFMHVLSLVADSLMYCILYKVNRGDQSSVPKGWEEVMPPQDYKAMED